MLSLAALYLAMGSSRREQILLTTLGAVGVWFSHPLALVLAGAGSYLFLKSALRSEWRGAIAWVSVSLLWALNFAGCYHISQRIVSKDGFLDSWWAFAYLPFPPRSFTEAEQTFWQLFNVINSPAGIVTPLGVLPSALIGAGLFLLGAWSLGLWRERSGSCLPIAPILCAVAASVLHRYPFHGRLLVFLIPSIHLLVAEGVAALTKQTSAKLTFVLAAFLLTQPVLDILFYRIIRARSHSEYDSHGDLHPDVLDYLDRLKKANSRSFPIGNRKSEEREATEGHGKPGTRMQVNG